MIRGTIPAAWADQGPAHEAPREPVRAAAKRRSAAARLFGAKRPRGAGAAGGEIIAPPHFCGAPRRSRSTRPSPGWLRGWDHRDEGSRALEAIEKFGDASRGTVLRAAPPCPRDAVQALPEYSMPMRVNPATGQPDPKITMSCSRLLVILSGFYNSASPLRLIGGARNLPLSGRYCDPRDSSVVGGDVLRCIHR